MCKNRGVFKYFLYEFKNRIISTSRLLARRVFENFNTRIVDLKEKKKAQERDDLRQLKKFHTTIYRLLYANTRFYNKQDEEECKS